ncbi:MAG: HAMP domain-containing sensor histidine kinase [Prevotella sp.]|nr:HAMP domain-containing sensor histidine kinase [Prevotella sp.]
MRKSTIWIVSAVMGLSFIALLFLQLSYMNDMVQMKKEQLDENVNRALYQASRKQELDETLRCLELNLRDSLPMDVTAMTADGVDSLVQVNDWNAKMSRMKGANKFSILHQPNTTEKDEDVELHELLRDRYVGQKALLDEVIYSMLYDSSDKPLNERLNFRQLDEDIRLELANNGINIKYHFSVQTSDGREVYRCADWEEEGSQYTYSQLLFRNDSPTRMGVVKVHFPEIGSYVFSGIYFMIPSLIFTIVLLITFIFTIVAVFRQKRLNEMRNDFIHNMTHELKTPVSSISLAAQMLDDKDVAKNETMIAHISKVIQDESKRLRILVDKVLQMSMFKRPDGAALKKKELDVNVLIEGVVDTFRLKVGYGGGEIITDLRAKRPQLYGDELHFTNVIFNLLDNAVKYKKQNEDLRLNVRTWNDDKHLLISISDNGIGIKKDNLKKIFEKFYRVHTGNVHNVKGFGLGLAYVQHIIEAHGGVISAESDFGKGTRFIIKLPRMDRK